MLAKAENLREEAANLSLILTVSTLCINPLLQLQPSAQSVGSFGAVATVTFQLFTIGLETLIRIELHDNG